MRKGLPTLKFICANVNPTKPKSLTLGFLGISRWLYVMKAYQPVLARFSNCSSTRMCHIRVAKQFWRDRRPVVAQLPSYNCRMTQSLYTVHVPDNRSVRFKVFKSKSSFNSSKSWFMVKCTSNNAISWSYKWSETVQKKSPFTQFTVSQCVFFPPTSFVSLLMVNKVYSSKFKFPQSDIHLHVNHYMHILPVKVLLLSRLRWIYPMPTSFSTQWLIFHGYL